MNKLIELKTSNEYINVEYEIITPISLDQSSNIEIDINNGLSSVESCLSANRAMIDQLNAKIDNLTNHADGIDNMVAVGSGVMTGLIDSFFVGEFSLLEGKEWGSQKINNFVMNYAQKEGYKNRGGDPLKGSISFLEDKFGMASDSATSVFGGGKQHHLRDFTHHLSPMGLLFSILNQFTGSAFGSDTHGGFIRSNIGNSEFMGTTTTEKIIFGTTNWFGHIVSDMAGSSSAPGAGTGVPGPLLSLLKGLATLLHPILPKNADGHNEFSVWVSKLFNGTLLGERNEIGTVTNPLGFDLRAEMGVLQQIGKQSIPILINECIVRGFYFIRRLTEELRKNPVKSFKDVLNINWGNTIPHGNRTIARMLTIATGTFMAVDMADAAVRSGLKSGGEPATFLANFALRVNFVGVGRFAIAAGADIQMGYKQNRLRDERISIYCEQLHLYSAKIHYKEAQMWIEAKDAAVAIEMMQENAEKCIMYFNESMIEIHNDTTLISKYTDNIETKNPTLLDDISNILKL